jgi:hypothetical protein
LTKLVKGYSLAGHDAGEGGGGGRTPPPSCHLFRMCARMCTGTPPDVQPPHCAACSGCGVTGERAGRPSTPATHLGSPFLVVSTLMGFHGSLVAISNFSRELGTQDTHPHHTTPRHPMPTAHVAGPLAVAPHPPGYQGANRPLHTRHNYSGARANKHTNVHGGGPTVDPQPRPATGLRGG